MLGILICLAFFADLIQPMCTDCVTILTPGICEVVFRFWRIAIRYLYN